MKKIAQFPGVSWNKFKIPVINVINIWKSGIFQPALTPTDFSLPENETFLLCILVRGVGK